MFINWSGFWSRFCWFVIAQDVEQTQKKHFTSVVLEYLVSKRTASSERSS